MNHLSSTKKGRVAEFALVSRLLKFGFEVFTPACDDAGVDLVVKTPRGIFVEMQLKARIIWKDTDTFIANDFPDDCTFFIVCYDFRNQNWFFLPGSFVKKNCQRIGKKGNWYVIPHGLLQKNIQYKNQRGLVFINEHIDELF